MKTLIPRQILSLKHLSSPKLHFVVFTFVLLTLASCAPKTQERAQAGVPDGPGVQSSLESLIQGLAYIRENPTQREDERVQRYLWLDQWVAKLQQGNQLNPELANEFWDDLTSYVSNPPMSSPALNKIIERAETPLGQNVAYYQLYANGLREGSVSAALSYLGFIREDQISDLYSRSQDLLNLKSEKELMESRKIGVLLPLSGRLANFGLEALNAIQLAAELAYSDGVEFVVEDVGETEDQLLDAFQSLALDENVSVVIGPITSKNSEFVFERAQILRTPVVSLALTEGLEIFGGYNFRSALTLRDQVSSIAKFIRNKLRARRVAMLFPDTSYGWDVGKLAEKHFKENGLEITEIQVYDKGETDFKAPLQKMTRLDFPKLRSEELCQAGEDPKETGCPEKLDDLQPILNFEVLFVGENSPDTAGLLLPTLPFLNLHGVQVIGLSGFHSPLLIKRAGASSENVIFTDGFYSDAEALPTQVFVSRYKEMYDSEPSNLSAEAFDVALMIVDLMKRGGGTLSREQIRQSLRSLRSFDGVTGRLYTDGQQIRKEPQFFSIRDGEFREFR